MNQVIENIPLWVSLLDEGDLVIVESSAAIGETMTLDKVNKITPKGLISVGKYVDLFNQQGWQRGGTIWSRRRLLPPTDDRIRAIKRQQMLTWLNAAKWELMSHEAITVAYMATRARLQWEAEQKEKQ
jgi:hypothetical protein